jgi:hypothetical protein
MNESMTTISQAELTPTGIHTKLAFSVNMQGTPSDDPIAYSMGFMSGYAGDPLVPKGEKRKDLAKAWIEGHKLGREVKAGCKPMPDWASPQEKEITS